MKYKWRKYQIKKLKKLAEKLKDETTLENTDIMLGILNNKQSTESFHIVPEGQNEDFDTAYEYYSHNMNNLPDNVYDYLMELFKIEDDNYDWFFERPILTPLDITQKDMTALGYDCLKELHDEKLLKTYLEIIKRRNHQLHITDKFNPSGQNAQLDGCTLYDFIHKKQYIYVYETHTAFDFETLIHEVLHAHLYDLNTPIPGSIKYLQELEGRFGNLLAECYLDKIGFGDLTNELQEYELRSALHDSYNLYVSDLLFGLAKNKKFDLEEVKKCYEEETTDKWVYEPDDLDEIYSIFGFDVATDLLCYLMTMDTYFKHGSIEETYHKMLEMKSNDDFDTIMNLDEYGYNFMNNNFENVNELRKLLKKEGV